MPRPGPVDVASVVDGPGVDHVARLAAAQRQERPHREAIRVPLVLRPPGGPVLDDEQADRRLERGVLGHQGERGGVTGTASGIECAKSDLSRVRVNELL